MILAAGKKCVLCDGLMIVKSIKKIIGLKEEVRYYTKCEDCGFEWRQERTEAEVCFNYDSFYNIYKESEKIKRERDKEGDKAYRLDNEVKRLRAIVDSLLVGVAHAFEKDHEYGYYALEEKDPLHTALVDARCFLEEGDKRWIAIWSTDSILKWLKERLLFQQLSKDS
jgi:hypothetical protein